MGRGGQESDVDLPSPSLRLERQVHQSEMFHVTSLEAVEGILQAGLRSPAFLWRNEGFAEDFAEEFFAGQAWAMIVVDVSGLCLEPDTSIAPFGEGHEAWISQISIAADRLRLSQ